jgi:hypothetical protein
MLANCDNQFEGDQYLFEGVLLSVSLNPFFLVKMKDHFPDLSEIDPDLNCFGVCDSPDQFLERYHEALKKSPRTYCVAFMHIPKPNNWGWRWHKWGEYIGTGNPVCEYLDDEPGFPNGVYSFSIVELEPKNLKRFSNLDLED